MGVCLVADSWGSPLLEVNRCHGRGRGHPCIGGAGPRQLTLTDDHGSYERTLTFSEGGKEVGHLSYWMETPTMASIEYIGVKRPLRGKGYGEAMYRAFADHLAQVHPEVTHIGGEVTSQGVFRLRNKVFGKPDLITDPITAYTVEEAMKVLPARSPERPASPSDEYGQISDAEHLFVRHALRRRRR